jgi:hypothetical protein
MSETQTEINPKIQRVLNIQKQFDNVTYQMYNHNEVYAAHGLALLLIQFRGIEGTYLKQVSELREAFTLNNYDQVSEEKIQEVYGVVSEVINSILKDTSMATPLSKQRGKLD